MYQDGPAPGLSLTHASAGVRPPIRRNRLRGGL